MSACPARTILPSPLAHGTINNVPVARSRTPPTIHLARGLPRSSPRHVAICDRVTGPTEPLTRLPLDNRPHMLVLSGDRHKAEVLDRVAEATENPAVKTA